MRKLCLCIAALAISFASAAQPIDRPEVKAGDHWTYRDTTEKGLAWNQSRDDIDVVRVTPSTIFYTSRATGSSQPAAELFSGSDWSRMRDVNGKETVVNRPLVFPLAPGNSWDVSYEEQRPNAEHRIERFENKFVVTGYETIEVPAGTFHALKVEAEGRLRAETAPAQTIAQGARSTEQGTTVVAQIDKRQSKEVTGRLYKAFWYAPEVKRWIKSVEEYYSNGGVRSERYTQELESFKAAD